MYNFNAKESISQNSFNNSNTFNTFGRELDYSVAKDNFIDSRVLQVCQDAETNFLENRRAVREIEKLKKTDFKFSNNYKIVTNETRNNYSVNYDEEYLEESNINNNEFADDTGTGNQKYNYFEQNRINLKNAERNNDNNYAYPNKSINFNSNIIENTKRSFINSRQLQIPLSLDRNQKHIQNASIINKNTSDHITQQNNLQRESINKYKIPIEHKHFKSGKKCVACELKNRQKYLLMFKNNIFRIQNNRQDIEHLEHVKFKINYNTNKLLLETKTQMKKLNFKKAYEMLKLPISQGLHHADIFYLFGEVCRVLKKLEESETYLLECLKFEHHSPFVFNSLGLLYQEISQFKYSICFFKHFVNVLQTSDGHYQLAKSYMCSNKNLKSAIHITKAINLNKNVYEYFKFREGLYNSMGFKELAEEDKSFARDLREKSNKIK